MTVRFKALLYGSSVTILGPSHKDLDDRSKHVGSTCSVELAVDDLAIDPLPLVIESPYRIEVGGFERGVLEVNLHHPTRII